MAHVFISYATPDRVIADEVAGWLRVAGHEPFLAHDLRDGISVGEDWEQRLYNELRRVDAVIGVVTSSFVASTSACRAPAHGEHCRDKQRSPSHGQARSGTPGRWRVAEG
jgi:hypothetical protein